MHLNENKKLAHLLWRNKKEKKITTNCSVEKWEEKNRKLSCSRDHMS